MENLEIGISETEKGFVVIPADEYSDMAMSIGALIAENERLKERVGEYRDVFRFGLAVQVHRLNQVLIGQVDCRKLHRISVVPVLRFIATVLMERERICHHT